MNIECILQRNGGTHVELWGTSYHFAPLDDGAHVANVKEPAHIDRFLSIPEAYKVYHGALQPVASPQVVAEAVSTPALVNDYGPIRLAGSDELPPQFDIGGKTYTQHEIAQKAFEASGLSSDEWNELGDDERTAKMEIVLDDIADAAEKAQDPAKDERAALVEAYKAKFGKAPHHKKSVEAIKAELEA